MQNCNMIYKQQFMNYTRLMFLLSVMVFQQLCSNNTFFVNQFTYNVTMFTVINTSSNFLYLERVKILFESKLDS